MTYLIRLRRHLVATLTIVTALSTFPALHTTPAEASGTRSSKVSSTFCDFEWQKSTWQVRQLIKCAARRWHVPGGRLKALNVAECESHFHPKAYNPGGYEGVFQQSTDYWPRRARFFGFPRWSAFNGRANIIVSVRMAHRFGWSAWSCA